MWFNKKVVAGLAITALGLLALAPNVFGAALPLLVMAACPLSMALMMRRVGGRSACGTDAGARTDPAASSTTAVDAAELQALRGEVARLRVEPALAVDGHSTPIG